jgi:hypothetical protein
MILPKYHHVQLAKDTLKNLTKNFGCVRANMTSVSIYFLYPRPGYHGIIGVLKGCVSSEEFFQPGIGI